MKVIMGDRLNLNPSRWDKPSPLIINNNNQPPAAEPVNLCSVSTYLAPVENTDGQLFVLYVSVERMGKKSETCQLVRLGQLSGEELSYLNKKIDDMAMGLINFIDNGGIVL